MVKITMLVLTVLCATAWACNRTTEANPILLSANIVDPEDVNAVSQFNSCAGHAYPETNSPNNGKNYFWPNSINFSTNNILKEFAACDGTAAQDSDDLSANEDDRGQTLHLNCDNSSTSLRYFHLTFDPGLVGQHVSAGALLGYASMVGVGQTPSGNWQTSSNFDIAVSDGNDNSTQDYFLKLSPAAFAAWSVRGLTSLSRTIDQANPTCSVYSSNIGDADIVVFSPAR